MSESDLPPLTSTILPAGIRSRFVLGVNGLRMRPLKTGNSEPARLCLLLLHGFPELAYFRRKLMPTLADAGYDVLVPDLRVLDSPGAQSIGMPSVWVLYVVELTVATVHVIRFTDASYAQAGHA